MMNWNYAGLECRSLDRDAHLLVINDAQEQLAVARIQQSVALKKQKAKKTFKYQCTVD